MNDIPSRLLRVDRATVIIFSILFSPSILGAVVAFWQTHQILLGTFLCLAYGACVYTICSPTIELAQGRLVYRALFKHMDIDLETITNVCVSIHSCPKLEFYRCETSCFSFPFKPFAKAGIAATLEHICLSNPTIQFDLLCEDMRRGDFGSVTRATNTPLIHSLIFMGIMLVGMVIFRLLGRWFF